MLFSIFRFIIFCQIMIVSNAQVFNHTDPSTATIRNSFDPSSNATGSNFSPLLTLLPATSTTPTSSPSQAETPILAPFCISSTQPTFLSSPSLKSSSKAPKAERKNVTKGTKEQGRFISYKDERSMRKSTKLPKRTKKGCVIKKGKTSSKAGQSSKSSKAPKSSETSPTNTHLNLIQSQNAIVDFENIQSSGITVKKELSLRHFCLIIIGSVHHLM